MRFTNRITNYMELPEPNQQQAATPSAFAALPQFAAPATGTHQASATLNIYQIARAQAEEQAQRRRTDREISGWN